MADVLFDKTLYIVARHGKQHKCVMRLFGPRQVPSERVPGLQVRRAISTVRRSQLLTSTARCMGNGSYGQYL
jgi:hypothetical protein